MTDHRPRAERLLSDAAKARIEVMMEKPATEEDLLSPISDEEIRNAGIAVAEAAFAEVEAKALERAADHADMCSKGWPVDSVERRTLTIEADAIRALKEKP